MNDDYLKQLESADLVPDGIVLIISAPTGKLYQNQTNGVGCTQSVAEGILLKLVCLPLPDQYFYRMDSPPHWYGGEQEKQLHALFTGPKLQSQGGPIDDEIADIIDSILSRSERTRGLKVYRTPLGQSYEAWVKVVVDSYPAGAIEEFGDMLPPLPASGILTWLNSD